MRDTLALRCTTCETIGHFHFKEAVKDPSCSNLMSAKFTYLLMWRYHHLAYDRYELLCKTGERMVVEPHCLTACSDPSVTIRRPYEPLDGKFFVDIPYR